MMWDKQLHGVNLLFHVDRSASGPFLQRCPTVSVCRASCGSVHGQEQSWSFAREHVWLQRRWSELGIRDLPSHDGDWCCSR